jgi:hypothetical protein
MPESRTGTLSDALLGMAVRRVRLLTVIALIAAVTLIALHDASWTSVATAGIAALALAAGWVGIWSGLWLWRRTTRRRGS